MKDRVPRIATHKPQKLWQCWKRLIISSINPFSQFRKPINPESHSYFVENSQSSPVKPSFIQRKAPHPLPKTYDSAPKVPHPILKLPHSVPKPSHSVRKALHSVSKTFYSVPKAHLLVRKANYSVSRISYSVPKALHSVWKASLENLKFSPECPLLIQKAGH